jgi:hypothetical protein
MNGPKPGSTASVERRLGQAEAVGRRGEEVVSDGYRHIVRRQRRPTFQMARERVVKKREEEVQGKW